MVRSLGTVALAAMSSGLLFIALVQGGVAAPLFGYFVQLPLMVCGFALGLFSAGLASTGAALMAWVYGGFAAAGIFLAIQVAPTLFVVQRLSATASDAGAPGDYPTGRILAETLAAVAVVTIVAVLWVDLASDGIEAVVAEFAGSLAEALGGSQAVAPLHALAVRWAHWLPAIVATSWAVMIIANALLGQALAAKSGMARRAFSPMSTLELPGWCLPALVAVFLPTFWAGGLLQYLSAIVFLLLSVAYIGLGLGVIHALVRKRTSSSMPIFAFYALFVIFSWPLALIVVVLGVVDDLIGLRRRLA